MKTTRREAIQTLIASLLATPSLAFGQRRLRIRQRNSGSSGGASLSATYDFTSTGWTTIGLPIPQGAVPAGSGLQIGSLTTQCNVKAAHDDGSARFAILTAAIPSTGSRAITVAALANGTPLAPTWPTAVVDMTILSTSMHGTAGHIYRATLPSFNGTDTYLSGALCREARVTVTPLRTTDSSPHPFLRVRFDVRSYNDGAQRVDVIGENVFVQQSDCDAVDYQLTITVNGVQRFQSGGITAGAGTLSTSNAQDWTCSTAHGLSKGQQIKFTSGLDNGEFRSLSLIPATTTFRHIYPLYNTLVGGGSASGITYNVIDFRHWAGARWRHTTHLSLTEAEHTVDFTPFYRSYALPEYLDTIVPATPASYLYRGPDPYKPSRVGIVSMPGDDTGTRPEIATYPGWAVNYLKNPSSQALRTLVLNEGNVAGSLPIHIGDSDAKPIASLDDYPTIQGSTLGNGGKGIDKALDTTYSSASAYQMVPDFPHTGSYAFIPYLLTGDRYYLDEMRYWANTPMLYTFNGGGAPSKDSRGGAAGFLGMYFNAARGWAWSLRNLADCAHWMPDDDAYKAYFVSKLAGNLAAADDYIADNALSPWATLWEGYSPTWGVSNEDGSYPAHQVVSPWQAYYLVWVLGHIADKGYTDGNALRTKIAQMAMAIYNEPSIPADRKSTYRMFVSHIASSGATPTYHATAADGYADMLTNNISALESVPMTTYYGAHLRLAFVEAVKLGLPNAAAALSFINNYSYLGTTMASVLSASPLFAIKDPS